MPGCWLALSMFCCLFAGSFAVAEEFAGKLERVDFHTITLLQSDNQKLVFDVDSSRRRDAAPFIGRWVTVEVAGVAGINEVVRLRSK
jgi:hypothetical protein